MEHKLTNITKSYHAFAKDQVLTEKQLNEFLNYFDEQDRLSRICLSGVGIVCGFEVSNNETNNYITISKGAAITTDGDLVQFQKTMLDAQNKTQTKLASNVLFTHYREYKGEKVNYDPQFDSKLGSPFTILPILELIPDGESKLGATDLSLLTNLDTKIIILYIESYSKEQDNCIGVDCENQGIEQVNRLKVLLIDEEFIPRLTRFDNMFKAQSLLETYLDNQNIHVPRVILNSNNTVNLREFAKLYFFETLNGTLVPLKQAFVSMLGGKADLEVLNTIITTIDTIFNKNANYLIDFQYRYDFLNDLVDTYHELKLAFLYKNQFCCPNINAFPKHIMLGNPLAKLMKEKNDNYVNTYRHSFYKSPILESSEGNDQFKTLVKRLESMCLNFRNRRFFKNDALKITPSTVAVPLGKRAVPFYYDFSQNLIKNWDFDKRDHNQYMSILGYPQAINFPTNLPIANPLSYSIDAYNFFRIEGHQGLLYDDALALVLEQKNTYSLPFDVKVLGISVEEIDELLSDQYKCSYRDLEVLLKAWASEQECISSEVTRILSSFSTKNQGTNLKEDVYYDIVRNPSTRASTSDKITAVPAMEASTNSSMANKSLISTLQTPNQKSSSARLVGPEKRMVKYSDRVEAELNTAPESVGALIAEAITQTKGDYAQALDISLEKSDKIINNNWEATVATSTITLPIQIIFSLTKLGNLIPDGIENINETTFEDYNAEIIKLCSYTKQLQGKYRSTDENFLIKVSNDTRGIVALLINQLTTICCSTRKLQSLLSEVESRKRSVLDKLDFNKFVAKNTGLEHKAGVGPGQTFIMVYVNRDVYSSSKESNSLSSLANKQESNSSSKRAALLIPKGTVIADFTLPYMCCGDCETVNFVLPKKPVELSLPTDAYCIDSTNQELTFTVFPEDGKITVEDAIPGVIIEGNLLHIDGGLFPAALLGTRISFRVDNEKTNIQLLVSKQPSVSIGTSNSQMGKRLMKFSTVGDNHSSLTYLWDFGDGSASTERNPTHQYALSNEAVAFNVTLTVTAQAGICPTTVSLEIQFEEITVNIDPGPYCENAEDIHFEISPVDANPVITGTGVSADFQRFSPNQAGPGDHELFFNGNLIQTVTVLPLPEILAKISITRIENSIKLFVSAENAESFMWQITSPNIKVSSIKGGIDSFGTNGIITINEAEPIIPLSAFSDLNGGDILNILVIVTNSCGSTQITEDYVLPITKSPTATLKDTTFCIKDNTPVLFEISNFSKNTILAIDNVIVDSNPPSFTPSLLSLGVHSVTINGIFQYNFTIVAGPDGSIIMSSTSTAYHYSLDIPEGTTIGSFQWKLCIDTNPSSQSILESTGDRLVIPFDLLKNNELIKIPTIFLRISNSCGEKVLTSDVSIYSKRNPRDIECVEKTKNRIVELSNELAKLTFRSKQKYISLSAEKLKLLLNAIPTFTEETISAENGIYFKKVNALLVKLRKDMLEARYQETNDFALLVELYRITFMAFVNSVRCYERIEQGVNLTNLSMLINSHFNPNQQHSFPQLNLSVLKDMDNFELSEILKNHSKASYPMNSINNAFREDHV